MASVAVIRSKSSKGNSDASYRITVSLGKDKNGKRIRETKTINGKDLKSRTAEARLKEVRKIAEQWEEDLKNRKSPSQRPDKIKLHEIIPEWKAMLINLGKNGAMKESTVKTYIEDYDDYCAAYFDNFTIEAIDKIVCQEFIDHSLYTKNLSTSTVRKHLMVSMSSIFNHLIKLQLIKSNPIKDVDVREKKYNQKKTTTAISLTQEQALVLLAILDGNYKADVKERHRTSPKGHEYIVKGYTLNISLTTEWRAYFKTSFSGGIRTQEMIALHWKDINFDQHTITINSAIISALDGEKPDDPKAESSFRTHKIANFAIDELRKWKKEQMEIAIKMGNQWKGQPVSSFDEQLVFPMRDGSRPHRLDTPGKKYSKIRKRWNDSVKKEIEQTSNPESINNLQSLLLPTMRAYDLRHTFATLELTNGTPSTILAAKLGHSTIQMIMRTYVHPLQDSAKVAPNVFDKIYEQKYSENTDMQTIVRTEEKCNKLIKLIKSLDEPSLDKLYEVASLLENSLSNKDIF